MRRANRRINSYYVIIEDSALPWLDSGYPLIFPAMALFLMWFRRGWTLTWTWLLVPLLLGHRLVHHYHLFLHIPLVPMGQLVLLVQRVLMRLALLLVPLVLVVQPFRLVQRFLVGLGNHQVLWVLAVLQLRFFHHFHPFLRVLMVLELLTLLEHKCI